MRSRRTLLRDAKLYLILDRQVHAYADLFDTARRAIHAGVDMIQLRDKYGAAKEILKFSRRLLKLTRQRVLYIINDRVDLAAVSQADGVHLGQEDVPLKAARRLIGSGAIIGCSCQTYAHAQKAQKEGADYIGLGSVYKTLTKPERSPMDAALLAKVIQKIRLPVFAIGGINLNNISRLKRLGVSRAAVGRAICCAHDVEAAVRQFKTNISMRG